MKARAVAELHATMVSRRKKFGLAPRPRFRPDETRRRTKNELLKREHSELRKQLVGFSRGPGSLEFNINVDP